MRRTADLIPNYLDLDEVDSDEVEDTTGHGWLVTRIISTFAENVQFHFYRVVESTSGGKAWGRRLVNAMGIAHKEDDVDIIHISLGTDHSRDGNLGCSNYRQPCRLRYAAQQAIDDGINVVASAGNSDQFDSIACPSLNDETISVGGFVAKCNKRLDMEDPLSLGGIENKPPMACWLDRDDDFHTEGIFCSGLGCTPYDSCAQYRQIERWSGNVPPTNGKPDVLAPAMIPAFWGVNQLTLGTSWAAAFVTAGLAEIHAGLEDEGYETTPQQLRRAVIEAGFDISDSEKPGYNYRKTAKYVAREFGLDYEYGDSRPDFPLEFDYRMN